MHPEHVSLSSLLSGFSLLVLALPAPGQPADSLRLEIERAVLRDLLGPDEFHQLQFASHAEYICVASRGEDSREQIPNEALLAPFEESPLQVVSVSECRIEGTLEDYFETEPRPRTVVRHRRSGDPAILYRVGPVEWVHGDSALARAEYRVNPRNGATYECDVRRNGGNWIAECAVRFVS